MDNDAALAALLDLEAVRALVHRYCDAVCHHDTAAWADTWAPDGVWDIGRGEVRGRDAIIAAFETAMGLFDGVLQLAHNGTASFDGDTGRGRWYFTEHARARSGRSQFYLAHYDDTYVRTADGWRFARRELSWHYQGPRDLSGTFGPPPGYVLASGAS